ncbi:ABC transporter ATP-binding protein, partial [Ameyamaea chiangmaiensis]|nr:ABC transporter ATP-binding protein [Ameyamaea chiangmaiensis]
ANRPAATTASPKKDDRRDRAEARRAVAPLRKKARAAEEMMALLAKERAGLESRLADPALYAGESGAEVTRINTRLTALAREHDAAEEAWLMAEEAIEAAQADV